MKFCELREMDEGQLIGLISCTSRGLMTTCSHRVFPLGGDVLMKIRAET